MSKSMRRMKNNYEGEEEGQYNEEFVSSYFTSTYLDFTFIILNSL